MRHHQKAQIVGRPVGRAVGKSPYWREPYQLSDSDWNEIQHASGLPDSARSDIQGVIDRGREGNWRPHDPKVAKQKMLKTKNALRKTIDALNDVSVNDLTLNYIFESSPGQPLINYPELEHDERNLKWIECLVNDMDKLRERCEKGLKNVSRKRGSVPFGLDPIVDEIDDIVWRLQDRRLTKGYKRTGNLRGDIAWISLICRHIDRKIGPGMIKSALDRSSKLKKSDSESDMQP